VENECTSLQSYPMRKDKDKFDENSLKKFRTLLHTIQILTLSVRRLHGLP
jgi:hypothetical protein